MVQKRTSSVDTIISVLSLGLLAVLLWRAFHLGLIRYFDADEFAYLHWAHNVFSGRVPYRDFLLYVPPGFLWMLAPLYIAVHGVAILTAARVFAWIVFVCLAVSLIMLFRQVRTKRWAVVAGVLFAFLPIPSDKMLEVRPDSLALLLAVWGLMVQIRWFRSGSGLAAWWSGVLYSLSILVLPKTIPQVAVAVVIAVVFSLKRTGASGRIMRFLAGLSAPILLFVAWVLSIGEPQRVWYSLTKLPLEVNHLGELFPMLPDLFFYPNHALYGQSGWGSVIVANHAVWLVGLIALSFRLVTPFLPDGKQGVLPELLIAGSGFVYVATFMYGYPMRHEQYLIPVAFFVSFYAADAIGMILNMRLFRPLHAVRIGMLILFGVGLYQVHGTMTEIKRAYTNKEDMRRLARALTMIPSGAYVFDLTGATVYFRDPYYVSAVPFGQWQPFLSRPLPDVSHALEQTQAPYVYDGPLRRIDGLSPPDNAYIRRQYVPVSDTGLLKRR